MITKSGQQEEAVIREEEQSPLSDEDYKRAGGLQEQDVFPTDGGLALYSADYFEGDIIGSLVNPFPLSLPIVSLSSHLLFTRF